MNQRALSLFLIFLIGLSLLLPGCGRREAAAYSDPPPLPELQTGEIPAWPDAATPEDAAPGTTPEPPETPPTPTDPPEVNSGDTPDPIPVGTGSFREESPEELTTRPDHREERPCSLEPSLAQVLEEQEGTWSLYLKTLDTLEVVSLHDEPMTAASLIKLYVAGAYYATDPEGENRDYCGLVSAMISDSSNESCNRLIDLLGKDNVNDFIRAEGCRNTELNRKMLEQVPVENYTSTRECGAVLEAILNETYVSPAASRNLLQDLKAQKRTGKLPAGVPHGVETANKTGELATVENDACIVWSPGGTYVLCVMASDLTDPYAAQRTITEISRMVYQFFNETQAQP